MTRDAVWWRGLWNGGLAGIGWLGWEGAVVGVDHLLDRARREAGQDDFGALDFLEPMQLLIREFEANANADRTGRQVFAQTLLNSLKTRLFLRSALREHPEIAQQPIAAPLFVVGLPRTGTTLLQGLLARLSYLRTPLRWETDLPPVPPALAEQRDIKWQIGFAQSQVDFANNLSPGLRIAHPLGALLPEECNPLMMTSFRSLLHCTFFRCQDYHDYLYRTRFLHAYDWHKLHLQVLAFGAAPRTWLLKAPVHLASLGELLRIYPDARVVFTHRDPVAAIPSMGALTAALHKLMSPAHDKLEIGRDLMRNMATMEDAGYAARANWPVHAPRFIDIRYADLVSDPLRTVRSILRHFEMPEDDELPLRIAAYLRENGQHRQGRHSYNLADFGLREDEIRTVFWREMQCVS